MLRCRRISPRLWWCQALAMVQISWLLSPELHVGGHTLWGVGLKGCFVCLKCFGLRQQEDCAYSWCWAEREWWATFSFAFFQQGQLLVVPYSTRCTKPWQRQASLGFVLYSSWVCPASEIGLLASMKSNDTNFTQDYVCKTVAPMSFFHFYIF